MMNTLLNNKRCWTNFVLATLLVVTYLLLPMFAMASSHECTGPSDPSCTYEAKPIAGGSKGGLSFNLKDFTGLVKSAPDAPLAALLTSILEVFIIIATPIIVLYIIYAGFLYVTAQGNATQVQTATRALTYAVIGAVLILGAVAIAAIIQGVVGEFRA